jgi:hypothetical protein
MDHIGIDVHKRESQIYILAARRGKQVAVVALARRLAGIPYALLRDGRVFEPQDVRPPRPAAAALVNV